MKKLSKSQRLSLITKELVDHPFKLYTLQFFSERFDCAKSTLSEDITTIEEGFKEMNEGSIISVSGAAGGVYYAPFYTMDQIEGVKAEICERLREYDRVIPGGYLYMNDLFFDAGMLKKIARCIVTKFKDAHIDNVVTIETKGIPLAMSIAGELNVPVAVLRKEAKMTEGTTLQKNYVTGSAKNIKNMALPLKALKRGAKVLLVDDFMKAGGTAKAMAELVGELDVTVVGMAVVLASSVPEKKLVNDYYTLVEFEGVDEDKKMVHIEPSKH